MGGARVRFCGQLASSCPRGEERETGDDDLDGISYGRRWPGNRTGLKGKEFRATLQVDVEDGVTVVDGDDAVHRSDYAHSTIRALEEPVLFG